MKFECKRYPKLSVFCTVQNKIAAQFKDGVFETSGKKDKDEKELIALIKKTPEVTYTEPKTFEEMNAGEQVNFIEDNNFNNDELKKLLSRNPKKTTKGVIESKIKD